MTITETRKKTETEWKRCDNRHRYGSGRSGEMADAYREVDEMDEGPSGTGIAGEEGEHEEPSEEEQQNVGRPHARVLEPRRVLVQIWRRIRHHIQRRRQGLGGHWKPLISWQCVLRACLLRRGGVLDDILLGVCV